MSSEASDVATDVRCLVQHYAPSHWRIEDLVDELPLMDEGIGFDSVRVVELIDACDQRFGVRIPIESLVEEKPTVGGLIQRIRALRSA